MRRIVTAAVLAAAAALVTGAAAPALALTVTPAPNRDQAPHLKQTPSSGGGVDLRDSLAADARPQGGLDFLGSQGDYRRTQSYSFGNVTTTITTGRDNGFPSFLDRDPRRSRFDNRLWNLPMRAPPVASYIHSAVPTPRA